MIMEYFVVDAFTNKVFHGNPAAVFVLDNWLADEQMQKIAIENNLSETAFTVCEEDVFELRWFTPDREIDLCGHATLATAFVLFTYYDYVGDTITFTSQSGPLFVTRKNDFFYLDFPSILPKETPILPEYEQALGTKIREAYIARDLFFVLEDEAAVAQLTPDYTKMKDFHLGVGVIVTASGTQVDFVSRAFFPKLTINEDPVCGSAHSNLIPYWNKQLNKVHMKALQVSARGGVLDCEFKTERVIIGGQAVLYAKGEASI
ncbi:PhzF family phenazine biosynthesis protein [Enterococcus sp. BWM-S5]|uniref:PhzF family phenazine biosynthesis protein n=1 Tax=Enterococcus larvae TaxID=2794352 RepID=A0ABS4CLI2_9ENTE|nr:PhzF family phenazine biosynthesis protein [Enterococcus larvae]